MAFSKISNPALGYWPPVVFAIVSLAILWPAFSSPNTFFGSPGDPYGVISGISLFQKYSAELYYSDPTSEVYRTAGYPFENYGLLSWGKRADPVFRALVLLPFPAHVVYNLAILLAFFFSATGAYLLALYLTRNGPASFLAGLAYGFSPYVLGHSLQHLGLVQVMFFPLVLLFGLKVLDGSKNKFDLPLFGMFVFLSLSSDPYHVPMTLLLLACLLVPKALEVFNAKKIILNPELLRFFAAAFVAGFVFFLLNFQVIFPSFLSDQSENAVRHIGDMGAYPANVQDYLIPYPGNRFFSGFGSFLANLAAQNVGKSNPIEKSIFLGFTVLALGTIGVFSLWKGSRLFSGVGLVFVSIFAIAFVLGLGSYWKLQIFSNTAIIPLPGALLFFPFNFFRVSSRFGILVMLVLSVFLAFGAKFVVERLKSAVSKSVFVAFSFSLIVLEFGIFSVPQYTTVGEPAPQYGLLESLPDGAVIFYPLIIWPPEQNYELAFWQRVYQKPLVNSHPGHKRWEKFAESVQNISSPTTPRTLAYYNVSYAVIRAGDPAFTQTVVEGLQELGSFPDARVFKVVAKPMAGWRP
ncbi:MAG: hypothetical protein WC792_03045 [Candidatus Micrarchaeia archaeon]